MKKYVAEWKEVRIVLTEDDYKILLERFDLSNFVKTSNGHLINRTPCPLCTGAEDECRECSFDLYHEEAGCIKIITEVLKEITEEPFQNMYIFRDSICLFSKMEEGKRDIALIRELLLTKFKVMEK